MTDPNLLPSLYQPQYFLAPEVVMVTVGDISVTRNTVILPHGRFPLRRTAWTIQDSTQVTQSTSSAGIALAVASVILALILSVFTCGLSLFLLFGLFFLLMKDVRTTGFVTVQVVGDGLFYAHQLPPGPHSMVWATQQVNQIRALAAAA